MKCHIDILNLYNTNCILGTKLKYSVGQMGIGGVEFVAY